MDSQSKEDFTPLEIEAIFNIYLESDMYQEALTLYPEGSEQLISKLRSEDNMAALLEIEQAPTKAILFEQAILEGDYATAGSIANEVSFVPERYDAVLKSLVYVEDVASAIELVKMNELTDKKESLNTWNKEFVNGSELADEEKAAKIKEVEELLNKELG